MPGKLEIRIKYLLWHYIDVIVRVACNFKIAALCRQLASTARESAQPASNILVIVVKTVRCGREYFSLVFVWIQNNCFSFFCSVPFETFRFGFLCFACVTIDNQFTLIVLCRHYITVCKRSVKFFFLFWHFI